MSVHHVGVLLALLGIGVSRLDAQTFALSGYRMVDLTHALNAETVFWPTSKEHFELRRLAVQRRGRVLRNIVGVFHVLAFEGQLAFASFDDCALRLIVGVGRLDGVQDQRQHCEKNREGTSDHRTLLEV